MRGTPRANLGERAVLQHAVSSRDRLSTLKRASKLRLLPLLCLSQIHLSRTLSDVTRKTDGSHRPTIRWRSRVRRQLPCANVETKRSLS